MALIVGQKIWVVDAAYRGPEKEPYEATIKSVGRKYFTIDDHFNTQFEIDSMIQKGETNYRSVAYLSLQEITDKREHIALSKSLRLAFSGYGSLPYSLDLMREINKLITKEKSN